MADIPDPDWVTTNRLLWDEWAAAHAEGSFYDLQGFIAGRSDLRPWERSEVGDVEGRELIHLQCHLGTDSLDWVRRGATVTALDFSARALQTVRGLSNWSALPVTTVEANVYDAVEAVGHKSFDIVYTGMGALNWLPNLDRWAEVVAELLAPGGVLYLSEFHPVFLAHDDAGERLAEDSIGAKFKRFEPVADTEGNAGSYAAPAATFHHTSRSERVHGLGELLSAVVDAGLRIELFREHELTPCPAPFLVESITPGLYCLPPEAVRFPLTYSLRARKV